MEPVRTDECRKRIVDDGVGGCQATASVDSEKLNNNNNNNNN